MHKKTYILTILVFTLVLLFGCGDKTTEFEKNFTISLKPADDFVVQGDSASFLVKLIPLGGFNSQVKLSVSNPPDSVTAYFEDSTLTPPDSTFLWMKADTAAPVDRYTLTLSGSGGGKTNSQTLILDLVAKVYELKLYFAKDNEERILSLNPDPTNPTDLLDDTTHWWGGFRMRTQDLDFDSMEIYFNFYVQKTNPDVKESIHFEVYFDYDSILADAWKKTLTGAPGDTEAIWFVDTLVVELDSPKKINKNNEIRVSLGARNFDLCRFRYGVANNDPYVRFH